MYVVDSFERIEGEATYLIHNFTLEEYKGYLPTEDMQENSSLYCI